MKVKQGLMTLPLHGNCGPRVRAQSASSLPGQARRGYPAGPCWSADAWVDVWVDVWWLW